MRSLEVFSLGMIYVSTTKPHGKYDRKNIHGHGRILRSHPRHVWQLEQLPSRTLARHESNFALAYRGPLGPYPDHGSQN